MKTIMRPLRSFLPLLLAAPALSALPTCLDGFTLYSHTQTLLGDRDSLASGKNGSNGYIELGVDGRSHGEIAGRGNVRLRDRSKVFANVKAGGTVTLLSGAQVTGTVSQGASVPGCTIPDETFSVGTANYNVGAGNTRDLLPGSYGDVRVYGNGTLKLRKGAYYFKSLVTEADGKLLLDPGTGNIEVFTSVFLAFGDRTQLNFTGGDAPQKVKFHSQQTTSMVVGTDMQFKATVVAPKAEIHVFSRTRLRGAAFGNSIVCEPDVRFFSVPYNSGTALVKITSPANGLLTNMTSISVAWTVNGVAQDSLTTEVLPLEGANKVRRCSGASCDSITVIRDRTAPVVAIASPADGSLTRQSSIAVAWTVDGVQQTTGLSQSLTEGSNTIVRTATDAAGNTGSASVTVICDTQAPRVEISEPDPDQLFNTTLVQVAWSVDGVSQSDQTSQTLADEGLNWIVRSSTDAAGNTGRDSVPVFRDLVPPVVAILSPSPNQVFRTATIPVSWSLDGVIQTTGTSESLQEGPNLLKRIGFDPAGNKDSATITVFLDTVPPMVEIVFPLPGAFIKETSTAVVWRVDGVEQTTETTENLAVEGLNTITRTATDTAGNSSTVTVQVTRDTQAPVVVITSPSNGDTAVGPTVQVEYTADGEVQAPFTYPLQGGFNAIIARKTDAAGNIGADTVHVFFQACQFIANQTVHFTQPETRSCLVVRNGGRVFAHAKLTLDSLRVEAGGQVFTDDTLQAGRIRVQAQGLIAHSAYTATDTLHKVHLEVGTLVLDSASDINVIGKGYPAGRGPGGRISTLIQRGGVHGGQGNSATFTPYGSALSPVMAGAGGANSNDTTSGGRGGGVVRIEADSVFLRGRIQANGGPVFNGSGAGGSVWIKSRKLTGDGLVTARGGQSGYYGGGGRIAITADSLPSAIAARASALGFAGGTVYLRDNAGLRELRIDSAMTATSAGSAVLDNLDDSLLTVRFMAFNSTTFHRDVRIKEVAWNPGVNTAAFRGKLDTRRIAPSTGSILELADTARIDTLLLTGTSRAVQVASTVDSLRRFHVIADYISVAAAARIDATGKGYPGGAGPNGYRGDGSEGGTHAGQGRFSPVPVYGSRVMPYQPGSGGGTFGDGFSASGGGVVRLEARRIDLNGSILASGGSNVSSGSGAGGSVWITADTLAGTGKIAAKGPASTYTGGGGRVALYGCAIQQPIRDSVDITGFNSGSLHLPCYHGSLVEIASPADSSVAYDDTLVVRWQVDGVNQTADTLEAVTAGWNEIVRCHTNPNAITRCDTADIWVDFNPPVVRILSPADGAYLRVASQTVNWTVDGVTQSTQTHEFLFTEGPNRIIRSYTDSMGAKGADTAHVILDTKPPVILPIRPAQAGMVIGTHGSSIAFRWSVDSVEQTPIPVTLDTSKAHYVFLRAEDLAGNKDSLGVNFYAGTLAPDVVGLDWAAAESVLTAARLKPDSVWADNDTVPTGMVFAQVPEAGDTLRYHFPVRYLVSRGSDAKDLRPISLSTDSMTVDPHTLASAGSVRIKAVNQGRAAVADSFDIVVFEDRDLDGRYSPSTDLLLGRGGQAEGLAAGDTLDMAIPVAGVLTFNGNRISTLLDGAGLIPEVREDNNFTHSMAACRKLPDTMDYTLRSKWTWADTGDYTSGVFPLSMVANINDDNGDGKIDAEDVPDVVIANSTNGLATGQAVALDGRTGHELWKVTTNHHGFSEIAVGDIDGDGKPEVVNVECGPFCWDRRLLILDNEGEVKASGDWRYFGSWYYVPDGIGLHDLDGDGRSEIIWGRNIHDGDANLVYPLAFDNSIVPMAAMDLDADGYQELVGTTSIPTDIHNRIGVVSFKEKKILVRSPGFQASQYTLVGKVDASGEPRLIKPTTYYPDTAVAAEILDMRMNFLKKYKGVPLVGNPPNTYTRVWAQEQTPFFFGKDSVRKLITIGSSGSHIPNTNRFVLHPYFSSLDLKDSTMVYRILPEYNTSSRGAVFDFNDDNDPEAVVLTGDTLHILASDGTTLGKHALPPDAYGYRVNVADADKDGHADLIVSYANPAYGNSIEVFSNPTWVGARGIYNQLDYSVTNVDDDGRIPRFPTPHYQANNTLNIQCATGHYACVDISASFAQIALDSLDREQATARIGNGGALELPAGIPVSFYVSHLGPESLLTTLYTPTRLKPGQYYTAKALLPESYRGSYTFRIAVDDSGNGKGNLDESNETNNQVSFTFLLNNHHPSATQPENQYAEPSELFDFQVEATDEEGDSLAYSLLRGPPGMTLDPVTGALHWVPSMNPPRCTVAVRVTDPFQGRADISFIVYVDDGSNQPPTLSSTPATTAATNILTADRVSTYTYSVSASDPESEGILEYGLTCFNCTGHPGSPPRLEGTLVTWTPFQPAWMAGDSARLSLRVTDARGGITTQNWTVHLTRNGNTPPFFGSAPDTTATEEQSWKTPVIVADLDGDAITLVLDTIPLGMSFSGDSLRWTPALPGSYVVRIGAGDGFDTTWQRFVLHVAPVNDAPRIVSAAPTRTVPGALYRYQVNATDEDGDVLAYSLARAPSGMTISPEGLVEWRPSRSQVSAVDVEVVAEDPSDAEDRQSWTLSMVPDTLAPTVHVGFSKNPARVGTAVTVTLDVGDNVDVESSGLTRNGTPVALSGGQYTFTPSTTGTVVFQGQAEDPSANIGTFSATLRITNAAELTPPEVGITCSPGQPEAGETVTFTVTVADTDGVDAGRQWVEVDGAYIPVLGGQARYGARRPGELTAKAVAFDSLGASAQASVSFSVSPLGGDATPPTAAISSPEADSVVYGMIAIEGTASDANLAYYTLSYRDLNTSNWVEYHRSTASVTDDSLGVIDATSLTNGDYEIRLDVHDRSGNQNTRSVQVQVAGEKKVGNFTLAFQDLTLPMSGMELTVTRTYDSRVKTRGDFGIGWKMGMRSISLHENRNQGSDWEIRRTPGLIPNYYFAEGKPHTVTITLPGGRKQEFVPEPRFFSPFSPTYGVMEYRAKPGTYSRLEAVEVDTFVVVGGELYDERGDFEEPFDPGVYRITLLDGSYFVYDQASGGVIESGDANGNVMAWENDAVRHNAGEGIDFTRDSFGRITSISDGAGRGMQYRYDVAGNLSEVLDANGNSTRFNYGPRSYLLEVIDARGVRAARTEYDGDGRMVRQINASGDTLHLVHDIAGNTEEIEDFNGRVTTYTYDGRGNVLTKTDDADHTWSYAYDSVGNLLSTTQPGGGVRSSTYDGHGNELTTTDELDHTTTREYDAGGRVLSSEDPLGRVTEYEYDSKGNLEREIGPGNVVLSERTYDGRGNLLREENALGFVTSHAYDPRGWLTSTTDPLGRVTSYSHDAAGNVIREINPEGDTTRHGYDANGNRVFTVNSLGDTVKTEYNAINKPVRQIDARGHSTRFVYDALGDKVLDIAADSSETGREYDAAGNVSAVIDPMGRRVEMTYDHENRLRRTTFAVGQYTESTYDALGRRTASRDANGNVTEYRYDLAGRDTAVIDAAGNRTSYEYDAAGRKTAMVDAFGFRTEYAYDAYDRLTTTTFADGTTKVLGYDLAGRKTSETDPMGRTTLFEYDSVGNLTAVVDAMNHRTEYAYDDNNNRLSQDDANNRTTSMEYDALGRMTRRTYPNGDQERWGYDANGNALYHVKGADSTAYSFDALNRETFRQHFPSGHEVITRYALDGKRDTVIDYRGTTTYEYDTRGRLFKETGANGDFIESHYDPQGNRTRLITAFGETRYGYDALNRMDTVTSPQNRVTVYRYNAVGNRDSVLYPNGASTGYTYDSLHRLVEVRNWSPADTLLSLFSYTLDSAGIRRAVEELDGSKVFYAYDPLNRLTRETRTGTHPYVRTYAYDNVGNRLIQMVDGDTTTYDYNNRDQLEVEAGPTGTTEYDYDAAGRLISKENGAGTTTYSWVDGDRLDSISGPGVAIGYTYDAEGRKVRETTPDTVRQFLVDGLLPYGQVILETDGAGKMVTEYVYGLEHISQERGGTTHWYLADGQGSVRQLADSHGFVSDAYAYTAFGEPLASTGSTANEFRYVGEQADPNSGFYYLRARWMDPGTGRFTSVDPFEGLTREPTTLHRYLYAASSPLNFYDPAGLLFFDINSSNLTLVTQGILRTRAIPKLTIATVLNAAVRVGVGIALATQFVGDSPSERNTDGVRRKYNKITIQFQIEDDRDRNHSAPVDAPHDIGVTKERAIDMLYKLYYTLPGWWPRALSKWTAENVQIMEDRIRTSPAIGPDSKNYMRRKTDFRGENHRIDLVNNFGINLRN